MISQGFEVDAYDERHEEHKALRHRQHGRLLGGGSDTNENPCVHIAVDYVLFILLLMGVLGFGGICLALDIILMRSGPWWQIAQYINILYPVFFVVTVLFWILWYFRGPCERLDDRADRCKRVFCSVGGVLLLVYVVFILCWSVPTCIFLYNWHFDGHEDTALLRLGTVTPDSFAVFALQPKASSLQLQYKLTTDSTWIPSNTVAADHATFVVQSLQANQTYDFRVLVSGASSASASFTSSVRTSPVPGTPGVYSFVWGSCWNGNMQVGHIKFPAFHAPFDSWQKVADLNPDFVFFIGDFIYIDHPHYIGSSPGDYAIRYQQAFGERSFQANARKLPTMFMYDDHEITDNWDAHDDIPTGGKSICFESYRCFDSTTMFHSGIQEFRRYLGDTNPPSRWNSTDQSDPDVELYFDYNYGDLTFFVADNRGFRSHNTANYSDPMKDFLGGKQLDAVLQWLNETNSSATFKFLLIPGALTNFINPSELDWKTGGGCDGYSVFPAEREHLISYIETNNIRNVFVLTGDVHIPYAIKIRDDPPIYEFSSSPMGGFASQSDAFDPSKPYPLDHPDSALEWHDTSTINTVGNPAAFVSRATIDSVTSPARLTIEYFKLPNLDTPLYERVFTAI
jgi:phosphodiesterase/alkaline phosphatase D-like protein